ncbi:MAG TPA: hypothetical protein PLK54_07995, partial [Ferruginibacter sp.]|nr:hypothetical protein [Ferruginibacter sp.]
SSSNNTYYYDIIANLLWVQQGLCAYTEMYLIDKNTVAPKKWEKGKFKKFEFLGQLDHFDPSLKPKKGWEWNNFFVIHSDVNTKRKRDKKIHGIIKPDEEYYDPFEFLEYDFKTHNFLPNRSKSIKDQQLILDDINTLGLNFQPIIDYRIAYLKPLIDEVQLGIVSIDAARKSINKFYTAFEMSILSLGL